jgi:hypothetical protein
MNERAKERYTQNRADSRHTLAASGFTRDEVISRTRQNSADYRRKRFLMHELQRRDAATRA